MSFHIKVPAMRLKHLTPILNVADLGRSFAWFESLGWRKAWDWGDPPTFGAVGNGHFEIFLCQDGQGCRSQGDADSGGSWMTWWVESPAAVDAVYHEATRLGISVTQPPIDYPWNTRECHIRHPDGHTFRVSAGLPEA